MKYLGKKFYLIINIWKYNITKNLKSNCLIYSKYLFNNKQAYKLNLLK